MTTRIVNGKTYHVHTNRHTRPLKCWAELERSVIAEWFGDDYSGVEGDDQYTPRFFEYLGAWYDFYEFEANPSLKDVKALGFDAWQTNSYFSATVVCFFDRDGYKLDGEIIVGRIHW